MDFEVEFVYSSCRGMAVLMMALVAGDAVRPSAGSLASNVQVSTSRRGMKHRYRRPPSGSIGRPMSHGSSDNMFVVVIVIVAVASVLASHRPNIRRHRPLLQYNADWANPQGRMGSFGSYCLWQLADLAGQCVADHVDRCIAMVQYMPVRVEWELDCSRQVDLP
jgi:hypothetical protein